METLQIYGNTSVVISSAMRGDSYHNELRIDNPKFVRIRSDKDQGIAESISVVSETGETVMVLSDTDSFFRPYVDLIWKWLEEIRDDRFMDRTGLLNIVMEKTILSYADAVTISPLTGKEGDPRYTFSAVRHLHYVEGDGEEFMEDLPFKKEIRLINGLNVKFS